MKKHERRFGKVCAAHPELQGERYGGSACPSCVKEKKAKWKLDNPQRYKKMNSGWAIAHPEKAKELKSRWQKANASKCSVVSIRRKAAKMQATPAWANQDLILAFYEQAQHLTKETGIKHQVDHIVPLQGRTVTGFHCEANLQILTARSNISKGNRFWPDQPGM